MQVIIGPVQLLVLAPSHLRNRVHAATPFLELGEVVRVVDLLPRAGLEVEGQLPVLVVGISVVVADVLGDLPQFGGLFVTEVCVDLL